MVRVIVDDIPFVIKNEDDLKLAVLALRGAFYTQVRFEALARRPAEMNVEDLAETVLRQFGCPASLPEILKQMAASGFVSRATDPAQSVRTVLSRSPKFESRGRGLWALRLSEHRPAEEAPDDSAEREYAFDPEDSDVPPEYDEGSFY
jgi:hypothetical protein